MLTIRRYRSPTKAGIPTDESKVAYTLSVSDLLATSGRFNPDYSCRAPTHGCRWPAREESR